MKTWEMLKHFTESERPNELKAYVITDGIKNDPYYKYEFVSMLDGVFYWNGEYSKGFRLNDFYNPLTIEWSFQND